MVKWIINLGKWMEKKFPDKKVVTVQDYQNLLDRITNLEANSVHKDAVKIIVLKLKEVQDEFSTVKTGLGMSTVRSAEIQAMLNGEAISQENI